MDEKMKKKIDAMSYEQLLHMVRFAPTGDPLFQGEMGEYILNRMQTLRLQPGGDEKHVRASKAIGW